MNLHIQHPIRYSGIFVGISAKENCAAEKIAFYSTIWQEFRANIPKSYKIRYCVPIPGGMAVRSCIHYHLLGWELKGLPLLLSLQSDFIRRNIIMSTCVPASRC